MLISIVTPSYNALNYIEATYHSIVSQTISNWEWVVTDDCSSDGTYEWLMELSGKDPRVRVYKNAINSGAAVSRNNSISQSSGDFIAFVDSDDVWLPTKLADQLALMQYSNVNFSFTAYELMDENENSLNKSVDTHIIYPLNYEHMLRKKATMGCSTVMLRKSAFNDISMPLIRTGQDYGLWLKLLKTGEQAHVVSKVLTRYRILPNSISRNKVKKSKRQWQIYREIEKLPIAKAAICFCYYAWRAVFRK